MDDDSAGSASHDGPRHYTPKNILVTGGAGFMYVRDIVGGGAA